MWTSEETILYRWIDYIRSGQFLQELGFDMNNKESLQYVSILYAFNRSFIQSL